MVVDMGEITEKNAEEWHWRYSFASKLNGSIYQVNGKDYIPTLDEIKKRIGLSTNVSIRTRKQFVAKVIKNFRA